ELALRLESPLRGRRRRVRLLERLVDRGEGPPAVRAGSGDDQRPVFLRGAVREGSLDLGIAGVHRLLAVELKDHRRVRSRLLALAVARDEERAGVRDARAAREGLRDLGVVLAADLEAG